MKQKLSKITCAFIFSAVLVVFSIAIWFVFSYFVSLPYVLTEITGIVIMASVILSALLFVVWLVLFIKQKETKKLKSISFLSVVLSVFLLVGCISVFYSGSTTSLFIDQVVMEDIDGQNCIVWHGQAISVSSKQYQMIAKYAEIEGATLQIVQFNLINYARIVSFSDAAGNLINN